MQDNTDRNDKNWCENKCESQDEKHPSDSVSVFTVLVALAMQQVWSGQCGSLAQYLWHIFKKDSSHVRTKPEAFDWITNLRLTVTGVAAYTFTVHFIGTSDRGSRGCCVLMHIPLCQRSRQILTLWDCRSGQLPSPFSWE